MSFTEGFCWLWPVARFQCKPRQHKARDVEGDCAFSCTTLYACAIIILSAGRWSTVETFLYTTEQSETQTERRVLQSPQGNVRKLTQQRDTGKRPMRDIFNRTDRDRCNDKERFTSKRTPIITWHNKQNRTRHNTQNESRTWHNQQNKTGCNQQNGAWQVRQNRA